MVQKHLSALTTFCSYYYNYYIIIVKTHWNISHKLKEPSVSTRYIENLGKKFVTRDKISQALNVFYLGKKRKELSYV